MPVAHNVFPRREEGPLGLSEGRGELLRKVFAQRAVLLVRRSKKYSCEVNTRQYVSCEKKKGGGLLGGGRRRLIYAMSGSWTKGRRENLGKCTLRDAIEPRSASAKIEDFSR